MTYNNVYEVMVDNATRRAGFLVVASNDLAAEERAKEFISKLTEREKACLTGLPGKFYSVNELHPIDGIIV
jgi:hypothetical protein